jgi:pilus assembly protein Flp/PilA
MVDRINSLMVGAWLAARDGFKREEGQAMAEYALILAVIAVGVIAVLVTLQGGISSKLSDIATKISGAK